MGRIGCNDGERNYVVPVNYAYDGKFIIAHSIMGMKIAIMRKNPNVCFEVDEMKSYTKWKSVIVWGVYQELSDDVQVFGYETFCGQDDAYKNSKTALHQKWLKVEFIFVPGGETVIISDNRKNRPV